MSYSSTNNPSSFKIKGDISSGFGQFGLTSATIPTSALPTSQTPGGNFSDYYSHYVFNIDVGVSGDFTLAVIGAGGVSVGYTACIDCLTTGSPSLLDVLRIRNSASALIGQLWSGSKAFITAIAAPSTWKFAYAVPEGSNNKLLVYNGQYPQVNLLPIQKEISVNASNQYGIKSIQSWDATDATNLPPGSVTITNANKIAVMAGDRVTCSNLNAQVSPTSTAIIAACQQFTFSSLISALSSSVVGAIACHGASSGYFNLLDNSVGVFMAGAENCNVVQSVGGGSVVKNTGILWSDGSSIDCSAAGIVMIQNAILTSKSASISGQSSDNTMIGTNQCTITSSDFCSMVSSSSSDILGTTNSFCSLLSSSTITATNNSQSSYIASFDSAVTGDIQATLVASDRITLTGDGNFGYDPNPTPALNTGYLNNRAGISVISSHDVANITSAADIRYCVIGGYHGVTWSIDSKTGIHYGSNFNNTQPLPGFAEMFENASEGALPNGRLLQLENGKVRLARNGESGFMISRPYKSAAFVAGNPYHDWHKKYLTDPFGEELLVDGQKQLNPDYDPECKYVARSDRPDQWTTCEKSGIVVVEYTGEISIGDFLISGADGVAKRSLRKSNIRVLEIVNSSALTSPGHAKVDLANQHIADYIDEKVAIEAGIATSLPVDISIKDIGFANDKIIISDQFQIKISISLLGDFLLASDVVIALVGKNNSYDLAINYSKVKSTYAIKGLYKGIVEPDEYQIAFSTSKTLPSDCRISIKV